MLIGEICREPYSHCTASLLGYGYVPDPADVNFLRWVDARQSMSWTPKHPRPRPVDRPWETTPARVHTAPDPGRTERRARLRERLGIAS